MMWKRWTNNENEGDKVRSDVFELRRSAQLTMTLSTIAYQYAKAATLTRQMCLTFDCEKNDQNKYNSVFSPHKCINLTDEEILQNLCINLG